MAYNYERKTIQRTRIGSDRRHGRGTNVTKMLTYCTPFKFYFKTASKARLKCLFHEFSLT